MSNIHLPIAWRRIGVLRMEVKTRTTSIVEGYRIVDFSVYFVGPNCSKPETESSDWASSLVWFSRGIVPE
jgi:hypothetical protein